MEITQKIVWTRMGGSLPQKYNISNKSLLFLMTSFYEISYVQYMFMEFKSPYV